MLFPSFVYLRLSLSTALPETPELLPCAPPNLNNIATFLASTTQTMKPEYLLSPNVYFL